MRAGPHDLSVAYETPFYTGRAERWGHLDVVFEKIAAGDHSAMFQALPDGACQSPHWGYMVKGRMRVRYRDHEEVISGGDAFYMPPGHVPVSEEDLELVWFGPEGGYEKVMTALLGGLVHGKR